MKHIYLLIIFQFSCILSFAQIHYSRARIFADDYMLKRLSDAGVTIDHGVRKKGVFFESDFSSTDLEIIRNNGVKYTILIEDVRSAYKSQSHIQKRSALPSCASSLTTPVQTPGGFSLGSMGGFYTYQELLAQLDSMHAKYPSLITMKTAADVTTTIEGRPVYYVKISDNPTTDEPEPEVLYTALHHAREPAGMHQLIFYMYYLLENYQTDPEIQAIINNTELYFIPCINPDGYIENEMTDPAGGGMWRKNKRDNGDGSFGVDLNRNYGYFWGYDNTGSSPNTSSDTYRGSSGFSEPETQIMRNFANNHEFRVAINYHTYGNLLVHPWGYESIYTPDSAIFTDFGIALTRENNFKAGTALQTVGYNVNGGSDDWLYGDVTNKPKVFSFTPEAGDAADGFWPASFLIEDICKSNIIQNLTAAHLASRYLVLKDQEPQFITQTSGHINYTVKRLGLDSSGTYTVSITPVGAGISGTGPSKTYSGFQLLEIRSDSISYSLGSVSQGQPVTYILSIDNGYYTHRDTITKYFGQPVTAFSSSGASMTGFSSTGWGVTTEYAYTPSTSITDSPFSNYAANETSVLALSAPVSLMNTSKATLRFNARWEIEAGWDYAQLQVSADNGGSWTPLCGKYTKQGNQFQDPGEPVYDGTQMLWVNEEVDLSAYINQDIRLRFLLVSDGFVQLDGFYVDDLVIERLPQSLTSISNDKSEPFMLYPNPARQMIHIIHPGSYSATIYNSTGSKVYTGIFNREGSINIESLPSGYYFVEVKDNEAAVRRSFIVE